MKESRLTIGKRLGLGFGTVLLLSVAMGLTGYYSAHRISEDSIEAFRVLLRTDAAILEHSSRARSNVLGLRRFEKDVFLNIESKEAMAKYLDQWKNEREHLLARLNDIEKAATLGKDNENVKTMRASLAGYEDGFTKVFNQIQEGKIKTSQEGNAAIDHYKGIIHTLEQATKDFSSESSKRMSKTEGDIRAMADRAKLIAAILMTISVGLGTLICILAVRSITRPLRNVTEGLNEGADQVAAASGQVSSSSQQLAQGASEQAASIEETSSSLEEMSSMTRRNAENASQADRLMVSTKEVVSRSSRIMDELTTSMGEISKASEETSKIIKTIDGIAFQTNLLALNAAVEAARAGEAGAGFAVVADEVRNLAMRTAEAAKNTADLIEGTVHKVKAGSELVGKSGKEFHEVALNVERFGELIGQISAATHDQAQGIEQINKAVSEMDKVVQQNAANAEECASATEEMNAQAVQMKGFVRELEKLIRGAGDKTTGGVECAMEKMPSARPFGNRPASEKGGRGRFRKGNGMAGIRPEQLIPLDDKDLPDF